MAIVRPGTQAFKSRSRARKVAIEQDTARAKRGLDENVVEAGVPSLRNVSLNVIKAIERAVGKRGVKQVAQQPKVKVSEYVPKRRVTDTRDVSDEMMHGAFGKDREVVKQAYQEREVARRQALARERINAPQRVIRERRGR